MKDDTDCYVSRSLVRMIMMARNDELGLRAVDELTIYTAGDFAAQADAPVARDPKLAALRPDLAQPPSDTIPVPRTALQWLFGEQPGPDGKWFGETEPLPSSTRARPYWWRSKFRDMIPALSLSRPDGNTP